MSDINSVSLTGNLGQDPELKYIASGKATVSASIAVSGFSKEKTDWVRLVFWEKSAEILQKFCKKGDKIGVVGRLSVRDYQDNSGNKRTATEVVVSSLTLLGGKKERPQTVQIDEIPF